MGTFFLNPNSVCYSGQHGDDNKSAPVCGASAGGPGGAAAAVEPAGLWGAQPAQSPPVPAHRPGKYSLGQLATLKSLLEDGWEEAENAPRGSGCDVASEGVCRWTGTARLSEALG